MAATLTVGADRSAEVGDFKNMLVAKYVGRLRSGLYRALHKQVSTLELLNYTRST